MGKVLCIQGRRFPNTEMKHVNTRRDQINMRYWNELQRFRNQSNCKTVNCAWVRWQYKCVKRKGRQRGQQTVDSGQRTADCAVFHFGAFKWDMRYFGLSHLFHLFAPPSLSLPKSLCGALFRCDYLYVSLASGNKSCNHNNLFQC